MTTLFRFVICAVLLGNPKSNPLATRCRDGHHGSQSNPKVRKTQASHCFGLHELKGLRPDMSMSKVDCYNGYVHMKQWRQGLPNLMLPCSSAVCRESGNGRWFVYLVTPVET